MKVCGFSFIRNGVKFDYPFAESLRSLLPLCDKVIVAVGNSDDDTLNVVKSIDPKIEVFETVWDDTQKAGGRVLALETEKAFRAIADEYDWAFYLQGDEILHEKDYPAIRHAMEQYVDDKKVDGLLFNYCHFFGSYDFVGAKYSWYRREVRIIRNNKDFFSYRDAQGFRKKPNDKLNVKLIDATVYHYGWVRKPDAMQEKIKENIAVYKKDKVEEYYEEFSKSIYNYQEAKEPVKKFTGEHPAVMHERIEKQNWPFTPDLKLKYASSKDKLKRIVFSITGWIPGEYKNYKKI